MNTYLQYLESRSKRTMVALISILVVVIGTIDYITGVELSFSAFYLLPVALGAWFLGRRTGVFISVVSVIVWYLGDLLSSSSYSHPLIPYWNALVMFGGFFPIALVLSTLRQTLDRENELAGEVQRRLLPTETPRIAGYEIAGAWQPAQSVSGDYYDVIRLDDDSLALCIADVIGHGIPAALLMSNLQAAVRMLAISKFPPRDVCDQLNKVVYNNTTRDKFITFFYGILDLKKKEFVYTNAGHNRPIIIRKDGERVSLSEGGIALGLTPDSWYKQGVTHLQEKDLLLIYTDGVVEARNMQQEEFGEDRLLQVLTGNHPSGANAVCDRILKAVSEFSNQTYQDDLALLALSVLAPDVPSRESELSPNLSSVLT